MSVNSTAAMSPNSGAAMVVDKNAAAPSSAKAAIGTLVMGSNTAPTTPPTMDPSANAGIRLPPTMPTRKASKNMAVRRTSTNKMVLRIRPSPSMESASQRGFARVSGKK